jgi:hypothetical protein
MVRARMLCHGVDARPSVKQHLVDKYQLDGGFILGAVFLLGGYIPVNTAFVEATRQVDAEPVELKLDDAGVLWVSERGQTLQCPPLAPPQSLRGVSVQDRPASDFLRLHAPKTLFLTPVRQCIFGAIGKPCTFCTFEMQRVRRLAPDEISRLVEPVLAESPEIQSIAVGGGTPNLHDYGARYYAEVALRLKQLGLTVSVEIVPGEDDDLKRLAEAGVDSLVMSLEIWDEAIRRSVCLGKGELSRDHYFKAWETAQKLLGENRVASVFLVGLEPLESTRRGVERLIASGVTPTLIPYREYDDGEIRGIPAVDPNEYIRLAVYARELLADRGLDAAQHLGCTGCGGCSMEIAATGAAQG